MRTRFQLLKTLVKILSLFLGLCHPEPEK